MVACLLKRFVSSARLPNNLRSHDHSFSTIVAWGSNSFGQAGAPSFDPILLSPQEIALQINKNESKSTDHIEEVYATLSAGSTHSAIVTASGEAYTFGSSVSGQLGLGNSQPSFLPSRVESLINRSFITNVSLGSDHTFFLDERGIAYAAGTATQDQNANTSSTNFDFDNVDDSSHHTSYIQLAESSNDNPPALFSSTPTANKLRSSSSLSASIAQHLTRKNTEQFAYPNIINVGGALNAIIQQQQQHNTNISWESMHLIPLVDHSQRLEDISGTQSLCSTTMLGMLDDSSAHAAYETAFLRLGKGFPFSHVDVLGAHQFGTPIRLGILGASTPEDSIPLIHSIASCISGHSAIVLSAATRLPYVLRTTAAGTAAHHRSSVAACHAHRQSLVPPGNMLRSLVQDGGGAVAVAAGRNFYAALCTSGDVLVWWTEKDALKNTSSSNSTIVEAPVQNHAAHNKIRIAKTQHQGIDVKLHSSNGIQGDIASPAEHVLQITFPSSSSSPSSSLTSPPITMISTGADSLIMSNGISVWSLQMPSSSSSAYINNNSAHTPQPPTVSEAGIIDQGDILLKHCSTALEKVLDLGDDTAVQLASGNLSHAVVTSHGRLWMWGWLMEENDIKREMYEREKEEGFGHWAYSKNSGSGSNSSILNTNDMDKRWSGLGSDRPVIVPGLHGVKKFALGGSHAIAEVA